MAVGHVSEQRRGKVNGSRELTRLVNPAEEEGTFAIQSQNSR